jgi:hypothetical protein
MCRRFTAKRDSHFTFTPRKATSLRIFTPTRAKFWLRPVRLAYAESLKVAELREAEKIVKNQQTKFLEKWHEFFQRKS